MPPLHSLLIHVTIKKRVNQIAGQTGLRDDVHLPWWQLPSRATSIYMARARASLARSAYDTSTESKDDGENYGDGSETHDDETGCYEVV